MASVGIALAAFVAGLFGASRVVAWVALLLEARGQPQGGFSVVPLLLHSGLWIVVALAVGAWWGFAHAPFGELVAAAIGLVLSFVVLGGTIGFAAVRRRSTAFHEHPLADERFQAIRLRFYWLITLTWACLMGVPLAILEESIILFLVCLGSGWLFAWFMWQWYGETLKKRERWRLKRKPTNDV